MRTLLRTIVAAGLSGLVALFLFAPSTGANMEDSVKGKITITVIIPDEPEDTESAPTEESLPESEEQTLPANPEEEVVPELPVSQPEDVPAVSTPQLPSTDEQPQPSDESTIPDETLEEEVSGEAAVDAP